MNLAFVTSLRAKAMAADWPMHVRLLDRMLASCLAQTNPDVAVVIVGNDRPEIATRDPRVHFIQVDVPLPKREFNDLTVDKVLKVTVGAEWAIAQKFRFLMYADADDLISRRLSAFVADHQDGTGWYFTDGYSHRYGQPFVMRSPDHHLTCGTCAIFRTEALSFAHDPEYRNQRVETVAAIGHTNYVPFLAQRGYPLAPLPFPGSIYLQHADSIATTSEMPSGLDIRGRLRRIKQSAVRLRRFRPLTPAIAREFTIARTAV